MRQTLTPNQTQLHRLALDLSARHRKVEAELCACLREIDRTQLYKKLSRRSLFQYAIRDLRLAESVAYAFIAVARKSDQIPHLKCAIEDQTLSVSKASRVVSGLTLENAAAVIAFAQTHTSREIDCDMARRNPRAAQSDRIKPLNSEEFEVRGRISKTTHAKYERTQSILAQKGKLTDFESVLDAALEELLDRHDPVRKAERAHARKERLATRDEKFSFAVQHASVTSPCVEVDKEAPKLRPNRVNQARPNKDRGSTPIGEIESEDTPTMAVSPIAHGIPRNGARPYARIPLSAETKHAVFLRDQGRCTHVDERGERCGADRWIDVHHIKLVSHGGTNELSNLTTLCSFHHDLIHQLSFPIEGQITWLRAPRTMYRA